MQQYNGRKSIGLIHDILYGIDEIGLRKETLVV
jgi:hypothetical protein